jgi:hypothetical protein
MLLSLKGEFFENLHSINGAIYFCNYAIEYTKNNAPLRNGHTTVGGHISILTITERGIIRIQ